MKDRISRNGRKVFLVLAGIAAAVIPAAMATFPAPVNGPILFGVCSTQDDDAKLYRINPDGTGRRKLTDYAIVGARTSPEGSRVAISVEPNMMSIISIDGGAAEPIPGSELLIAAYDPAWTPDANSLVFECDTGTNQGLCVIPVTGGAAIHIAGTSSSDEAPNVSPDGLTVAFDKTSVEDEIYTIPIGGGVATQITDCAPTEECEVPVYSPDGTRLVIEIFNQITTQTCAALVDLTASLPVVPSCMPNSTHPDDSDPHFSSDGLEIVVDQSDGHLARLGANGVGRQVINTGFPNTCGVAWGPFVDKKAPEAFCGQFFFDAQRRAEAKKGSLSVKFINKGCDSGALTILQPDLVKFDAAIDKIALKANENILEKGGAAECDADLVAEFADGVDPLLIERIDLLDGAATGADFLTSEVMDFCDS